MLCFQYRCTASSTTSLRLSLSTKRYPSRFSKLLILNCLSTKPPTIANYGGVELDETVDVKPATRKLRLDAWISSRIAGISRARVQSSIRSGLVTVNGLVVNKVIIVNFFFCSLKYSVLEIGLLWFWLCLGFS